METRCVDVLGIRHEVRAIDHEHNERVDHIVKPFDNLKYRPNHHDQECRNAEGSQSCPLLLQRVVQDSVSPKNVQGLLCPRLESVDSNYAVDE